MIQGSKKEKKALIVVNLAGFLTFLWNDISTLRGLGYKVYIAGNGKMSDGTNAVEIQILEKMDIPFYQVEFDTKSPLGRQNVMAFRQLKKILKNERFELVHCHTPIVGLLVRCAANAFRKNGTKVIYTTHGFTFTDKSSKKVWLVYYTIEKFASRFCDAIITINHEDFENAKTMHCKKVYCISGVGVDTQKYAQTTIARSVYRQKLGVDEEEIMILSVGELSQRKNHQIIIRALGKLQDSQNSHKYVYVICGREVVNSGMEEFLLHLANDNNVRLILAGHRADIPEINKCCDIAAIPSLREGLGLAGVEALASGIPVVGADVQGIREYVINGETGFLCSPSSVEEFAYAIEKLTDLTKSEKEKYSSSCMHVAKRFDVSVSKQQMQNIYEEISS